MENILIAIAVFSAIFVLTVLCVCLYEGANTAFKKKETYFVSLLISVPVCFIFNAIYQSISGNFKGITGLIDFSGYPTLPNYLAFFAATTSVYFIYKTLNNQKSANQLSAFENRFFKFIDYHRENVNQLKYRDPSSSSEKYWTGNQVFTVIHYEIRDLIAEFLNRSGNAHPDKDGMKEVINFVYQCIFFGAGEDGLKILKSHFKDKLNYFENIVYEGRTAAYGDYKKYYSGHVRRLGHYYRNIYQTVKYVDDQTFLTPEQKYEYVTHFRAQMSVYEQSVFFFNSLSDLGATWEFNQYSKEYPTNPKKIFNKLLITKYDLVRNTLLNSGEIASGINIADYYPLLNVERNEEAMVCGQLGFKGNNNYICRFCFNEKYIGYKNKDSREKIEDAFNNDKELLRKLRCDELNCETSVIRDEIMEATKNSQNQL